MVSSLTRDWFSQQRLEQISDSLYVFVFLLDIAFFEWKFSSGENHDVDPPFSGSPLPFFDLLSFLNHCLKCSWNFKHWIWSGFFHLTLLSFGWTNCNTFTFTKYLRARLFWIWTCIRGWRVWEFSTGIEFVILEIYQYSIQMMPTDRRIRLQN
jgi:hypothetical protein